MCRRPDRLLVLRTVGVLANNLCLRQRRIKCDETKPECLRCQRSSRFCAGHEYSGFAGSPRNSSSSPGPPRSSLATVSSDTASASRLSRLGCSVFSTDSHCLFGPAESLFYSRLLPQFSDSIPFVSAATAAFGAAYSATLLQDHSAVACSEVLYSKALRQLQDELNSPEQRFIPTFISSILLAGAEVISGRQRNAVVYLLSVFAIFFPNEPGDSPDEGARRLLPAVNEIRSAGGSADTL